AGGSSVAALLPSGRAALPSSSSSASNLPGPQLLNTLRTAASSTPSNCANGATLGANAMISPTFRSRFAQPSSRAPIPGANELSTVLWHNAQVIPTDSTFPARFVKTRTPTTALRLSSASVTAGSSRFTRPARSACTSGGDSARASTLRPNPSAAFGLKPGPTPPLAAPAIAWCNRSAPPQKSSSPNVSKRNVLRPRAICCATFCQTSASLTPGRSSACAPPAATVTTSAANVLKARDRVSMGRSSFRGRSLNSDACEYRCDDGVAVLPAERERLARDVVELPLQLLLQHVSSAVKTRLDRSGLYAEQLGGLGDAELLDAAQHED